MIERIRVRNYRSLRDVEVRLEPLTVLIGRSGGGKSNFVRAVRLLRDMIENWHSNAGYMPNLRYELTKCFPFDGDNSGGLSFEVDVSTKTVGLLQYVITFDTPRPGQAAIGPSEEMLVAGDRGIFHQAGGEWRVEATVQSKPAPRLLALGVLTGVKEVTVAYIALTRGIGFYDFPGTVLQDGSTPLEGGPGYPARGDTHLAIARRLVERVDRHDEWATLGRAMASISPRFTSLDLLLPDQNQLRSSYAVPPDGHTLTADVAEESEGFRRYLAHLLALYQTPPKQTMFFEHPESGIHPGALEALAHEFKSHVEDGRGQVILTTHSPEMLDHFEPEQIRVVSMEEGQTRIGPLAAEQFEAVRLNLLTPGYLLTADPARLDAPVGAGA